MQNLNIQLLLVFEIFLDINIEKCDAVTTKLKCFMGKLGLLKPFHKVSFLKY